MDGLQHFLETLDRHAGLVEVQVLQSRARLEQKTDTIDYFIIDRLVLAEVQGLQVDTRGRVANLCDEVGEIGRVQIGRR